MRRTRLLVGCLLAGGALALMAAAHRGEGAEPPARKAGPADDSFQAVVARTAAMVNDAEVRKRATARGLNVLNLTWEDTGRFKNSEVGPNISDMTIQIQQRDPATGQYNLTCMPVIRFPNFADRSADVRLDRFFLLVGNEKGQPLRHISLWNYLGNVREHLTHPESWKGNGTYLLAPRDTHVLVSAQACFLPVPRQGRAEFNPVLFNYQSVKDDPAVLAILATREGTSATIIDNQRDGFQSRGVWGQRLFFNHNGERASLTGERLSDFLAARKDKPAGGVPSADAAGQKGLNMVLLIQVPLKQTISIDNPDEDLSNTDLSVPGSVDLGGEVSSVEAAVVGHGALEGPYTEIANLPIERDPRFPIRVTVQFYKATSNGVVSDKDMAEIKEQIDNVYAQADTVGSLVTKGRTDRPTEYDGPKVEPPEWWDDFWNRYEKETSHTRAEVVARLRDEHGPDWFPRTERILADEAAGIDWPVLPEARNRWLRAGSALALMACLIFVAALIRRRNRSRPGNAPGV